MLAAAAALGTVAGAIAAPVPDAVRTAQAARAGAARRVARLDAAAGAAIDPGARARLESAALAARVDVAEAEIAVAQARSAMTERALAAQRLRLAGQQGPVSRLLAALTALARRPAVTILAQPGSLDDLVHVQAALDAALPVVRARTAEVREELARTRALKASAAVAADQLRGGRARLLAARRALATLRDPRSSADAGGDADRALALGEQARDIVDQLRVVGDEQATLADLVRLPAPPVATAAARVPAAYRLPVAGRLVIGLGEVSNNGVRARGLTFAVQPGARVVAPAAGRVRYARPFRGFGTIVILDHGLGWVTLVTGLGSVAVAQGGMVAAGATLGLAANGDAPQVTVELRRRGQPIDITRMIG